jgi:hypothetical protein
MLKKVMFIRSVRPSGNAGPSIYGTDVIDGFSSFCRGTSCDYVVKIEVARTENLPEAARPQ